MTAKHLPVPEKETEAWDPLRMMDTLRLLPFGGLLEDAFPALRAHAPAFPGAWMPKVDIRETEKEYVIDLALPGVRKEDVQVEVKDGVLTVAGEKKSEKEEKGKNWLRRESSYGSFQRSFVLPKGLHPEDVKATNKDGVLTLTMRKPAEAKSRGVNVKID